MDEETRLRAREKLLSIKDYIAYVEEIKVDKNLEDLYEGLYVNSTQFFNNAVIMSKWSTDLSWKKLREKVHNIFEKIIIPCKNFKMIIFRLIRLIGKPMPSQQ